MSMKWKVDTDLLCRSLSDNCLFLIDYSSMLTVMSVRKLLAVWKPAELKQALMPILDKLCSLDPESAPFLHPVDPIALCIPASIEQYQIYEVLNWQNDKSSLLKYIPTSARSLQHLE